MEVEDLGGCLSNWRVPPPPPPDQPVWARRSWSMARRRRRRRATAVVAAAARGSVRAESRPGLGSRRSGASRFRRRRGAAVGGGARFGSPSSCTIKEAKFSVKLLHINIV